MSQVLPIALVILPYMGWGFALGLLYACLRDALTPKWILGLFESEGEPSVRLVLAPIVVIYTLCMQAAGRIGEGMVQANYILAGTLLGLGTAKLVGRAFANRPAGPAPQIKANKAEVNAAGDANITTAEQPIP